MPGPTAHRTSWDRWSLAGPAVLLAGALMLLAAMPAWASKRVALVVGNSKYENSTPLVNPLNDAEDIAEKLGAIGFEVTLHHDLTGQGMRVAIARFTEAAFGADVALIYYAGHGIELAGANYVIPVDATMSSDTVARFEAVPLSFLIDAARSAGTLGVVMVDACRDNPFAASMQRTRGTRSVERGLAPLSLDAEADAGLLVSFATAPGNVALDGDGRNSPYAGAFLDVVDTPGQEVGFLFRRLRQRVLDSTGGEQRPILNSELPVDPVYFVPGDIVTEEPQEEPPSGGQGAFFAFLEARRSNDPLALEAFLRAYPDDANAPTARALLQELLDAERDRRAIEEAEEAAKGLLAWREATAAGTVDGYLDYIVRYPAGEFADQARSAVSRLRAEAEEDARQAAESGPLKTACLAASSHEVRFETIRTSAAIGSCRTALDAFPDDPEILTALGRAYASGDDWGEMVRLAQRAVDLGFPPAMHALGVAYYLGKGVPQDFAQSFELSTRASRNGFAESNYTLALHYANGQATRQDPQRAAELLIQSIEGGFTVAIERAERFPVEVRRNIQVILRSRGLYSGAIDGALGAGSRAALQRL